MSEKLAKYYDRMLEMQPKEGKHGGYVVVFLRDDFNEVIRGEYEFPKGTYRILSLVRDGIHWTYEPKEVDNARTG
ncbi:MAG: hypothetical protein WCT16_02305 [Candidatus Buchananbacteria bacterium]